MKVSKVYIALHEIVMNETIWVSIIPLSFKHTKNNNKTTDTHTHTHTQDSGWFQFHNQNSQIWDICVHGWSHNQMHSTQYTQYSVLLI